jgi:hypothetical protein
MVFHVNPLFVFVKTVPPSFYACILSSYMYSLEVHFFYAFNNFEVNLNSVISLHQLTIVNVILSLFFWL